MRDLARRSGVAPPRLRPTDLLPFFRHALRTDPKGFQVATVRGKIVAFAITILRGRWHFLAMFFALPGQQSHGIGRELLARAFDDPKPPRGTVRCVVASMDFRAQALYVKFGMLPRSLMYLVGGAPPETAPRSRPELHQIGPAGRSTRAARDVAARFDRPLRGVRRDVDHRFFLTVAKGGRFFEARHRGRTVGYVVVRGNGGIGPGGVTDPSLSADLLAAALVQARAMKMKRVSVWIPGLNEGALRTAFLAGLRIEVVTAWMAGQDLGDLSRYLPANGVLL